MKRYACYITLIKNTETNEIFGYTEHSFCMGMSKDRVRVERDFEFQYSSKKRNTTNRQEGYLAVKRNADKQTKKFAHVNLVYKVFRTSSKNCPVILDWREVQSMIETGKHDKYKWRNLPFTLKECVTF